MLEAGLDFGLRCTLMVTVIRALNMAMEARLNTVEMRC